MRTCSARGPNPNPSPNPKPHLNPNLNPNPNPNPNLNPNPTCSARGRHAACCTATRHAPRTQCRSIRARTRSGSSTRRSRRAAAGTAHGPSSCLGSRRAHRCRAPRAADRWAHQGHEVAWAGGRVPGQENLGSLGSLGASVRGEGVTRLRVRAAAAAATSRADEGRGAAASACAARGRPPTRAAALEPPVARARCHAAAAVIAEALVRLVCGLRWRGLDSAVYRWPPCRAAAGCAT